MTDTLRLYADSSGEPSEPFVQAIKKPAIEFTPKLRNYIHGWVAFVGDVVPVVATSRTLIFLEEDNNVYGINYRTIYKTKEEAERALSVKNNILLDKLNHEITVLRRYARKLCFHSKTDKGLNCLDDVMLKYKILEVQIERLEQIAEGLDR